MTLVRILKDWDWPDLLRQTPGQSGMWDGIRFVLDPVPTCDYLVVLNNRMKTDTQVRCPPGHVWALMQEPYEPGFTDWLIERHDHFDRVFTHHIPGEDPRYVRCPPAIPWHVNKTFDELVAAPIPQKTQRLSWIVGDAMDLPGHFKRRLFLEKLLQDGEIDLELYGKAIRYIEDKWDGLAPFKYSLAIENAVSQDLWTEKIADCFLSWTVPFYYGCPNILEYFPKEALVIIDIDRPAESLEKIKQVMAAGYWEKHMPALEEARRRLLYDYQMFPLLAKLIHSHPGGDGVAADVTVPLYRRSLTARARRFRFKLKRRWRKLTFR
ncbi:hypothetical protein D3OALGA1CA_498 [Olavius algarvensis associated proteobacterium Delta 3]|nr:hypothetical protein D3OALGB2SA_440 [Olavius algarvensis associated proteobacterium Delta 3]CAB5084841.1 hypothetical protein D3OALGA1CA_498 [Olavius algarvensis associated proteobacterium Delta 3]